MQIKQLENNNQCNYGLVSRVRFQKQEEYGPVTSSLILWLNPQKEAVNKIFTSLSLSVSSLSANGFPFRQCKTLSVRATCPVQAGRKQIRSPIQHHSSPQNNSSSYAESDRHYKAAVQTCGHKPKSSQSLS